MPEVCYFSVTQTVSILGLSRMSVYRMIYDGRLKATSLFSPADFYTFNDILKMTGRSRSCMQEIINVKGASGGSCLKQKRSNKLHQT